MATIYEKLGMVHPQEWIEPMQQEPTLDEQEPAYDSLEVRATAKASLDFFAGLSMPEVYEFPFSPVLLAIWNLLTERAAMDRDFSKLAIGIPRGHAKSTLLKLFILYCILYTDRKFILIVAATATLAENILADVEDMLNEPNIKTIFGDWKLSCEQDNKQVKKFAFNGRPVILAALGAGSSLRGLNLKHARPDIILMDDAQTKENAKSVELSKQFAQWIVGTLMKTKSPRRCLYIYVGNMYPSALPLDRPSTCFLHQLKNNPNWISFIVGAILADGTALWEDLHPLEQLLDEFKNDLSLGQADTFYAEVLNDPEAALTSGIDITKIPLNKFEHEIVDQGRFLVIDVATDKPGADDNAIGYFKVFDGIPVLQRIALGAFSPSALIKKALTLALEHGCTLIAVESVAYQYTLLHWFTLISAELGISGIEFVPVYPGSRSKNNRIAETAKALLAGDIVLASSVRAEVLFQFSQWSPARTTNKDELLDLLGYAPKVVSEFGGFLAISDIIDSQEYEGTEVWEEWENSPM